jgi:CRP-like cAMP-binding protein
VDVHQHWLMVGLAPDLVNTALSTGHPIHFGPGDTIFHEGDPADGLYLTLGGNVSLTANGPHGETFLAAVRPNEVLGELGVLAGGPRAATAQALSVCSLYFIPTEPFLDLLERSNPVCIRLLGLLALRLRGARMGLVELRLANVREEKPTAPL